MNISGIRSASILTGDVGTTQRAAAGGSVASSNPEDHLTDSDRDLVEAATGNRPGRDPRTSILAATIGFDRMYGRLSPGQDVSAAYLRDLTRQQDAVGGANPFRGAVMDRALAYLAATSDGRTDVSA